MGAIGALLDIHIIELHPTLCGQNYGGHTIVTVLVIFLIYDKASLKE